MVAVSSRIRIPDGFDPWRIQAMEHSLGEHALLQPESIFALAQRLKERGRIRTHSDQVAPDTPFNTAPGTHPNERPLPKSLSDVEHSGAWTSLLNIQTDDQYRGLVDEILDGVKPTFDRVDPGMCYRGGWIFVTAPRAVTPFHMDFEHNFIMQIHGKKRLYVWDPFDREVVSEMGQELFHSHHSRDLVRFKEEFRDRAVVFDLEPGQGGYMPSTAPHMVENGDGASITISFTFYTDSTRHRNLVYRGKNHLRKLGIAPRPFGASPLRDSVLARAMQTYCFTKENVGRVLKKEVHSDAAPYAFHLTS